MTTTCIRNAAWVTAWDASQERHTYLRDCDVVFSGNTLTHVGAGYDGPADETVDGRELLVMPGLINVHCHPDHELAAKGIREEHGVPEQYMTGLFERLQAFKLDLAGRVACAEAAYAELLCSGVTTLVDISFPFPDWLDLLGRSGLRGIAAPMYASASWYMENQQELKYRWDEDAGRRGFDGALAVLDAAAAHPSGRLSGMLSPAQIDTCSEELLRDSHAEAQRRGVPFTIHCGQAVNEFQEIVRRHGKTPVQYAHDLGLLAPGTVLGHCIFIDEHSWVHWHTRRDLALLADTGTGVAHCPTPFARYGQTMQHLGRYLEKGINVGMGTDVAPQNLLEEMRWAAVLARTAAEDIRAVSTADVFHAATVGGAKALQRDDLGRLAPGMKADLVLVDLSHDQMRPVRDPLRSLIFHAADRAVRDVYVDGRHVVQGGKTPHLDRSGALARLEESQARMVADVPQHDYAGRRADQITPLSLPMGQGVRAAASRRG